jgi:CRISPR system Cascade subunit CasD
MREFLLFTIYAPLASWGEIAVGEARGSWDRPSRSAVLGLIAAALGITREDQDSHDALDEGYGVAVRLDAPGTPMVDYHTAQTAGVSDVKRRGAVTRKEVLDVDEPFTMLSRREYRQDAVATVAVWVREGAREKEHWGLAALADALCTPVFTLYAGRKANALGLPLLPVVLSAEDLSGAFRQRTAQTTCGPVKALKPRAGWGMEVMFDPCEGFSSGMEEVRTVTRRDAGAQRSRWQFGERTVVVGLLGSVESSENDGSGVAT